MTNSWQPPGVPVPSSWHDLGARDFRSQLGTSEPEPTKADWKALNKTTDWLVILTILKNMKVNGKDYPIYYGNIKNVQHHQPALKSSAHSDFAKQERMQDMDMRWYENTHVWIQMNSTFDKFPTQKTQKDCHLWPKQPESPFQRWFRKQPILYKHVFSLVGACLLFIPMLATPYPAFAVPILPDWSQTCGSWWRFFFVSEKEGNPRNYPLVN